MAINKNNLSRREFLQVLGLAGAGAIGMTALSACGQGARAEARTGEQAADVPVAAENGNQQQVLSAYTESEQEAPAPTAEAVTSPEKADFLAKLAERVTERLTYKGRRDATMHSAALVSTANEILRAARQGEFDTAPDSPDWGIVGQALYAKTPFEMYKGEGKNHPSNYFAAIARAAKDPAVTQEWVIKSAKHPSVYSGDGGGAVQVELVVGLGEEEDAQQELWDFIVSRDLLTDRNGRVISSIPTDKRGLSYFNQTILQPTGN